MQPAEKSDPHDRSSTNEGLRIERERTDAELGRHSKAVQDVASDVVAHAREQADTVLSAAREREDLKLNAGPAIASERAREDAALESARTDADAVLRDERVRRQRALASLLASEREYTDQRLETERERVDQALTSREDLLAMVSHDLRNLLGGVALSAELLTSSDSTENVRSQAARIQRCTAQMSRLVGDLMDVASIEAGPDVCFAVRDTGRGIAPDMLDKVFDRYFQVRSTDRRGLGLGLFITKSIVEAHGGAIRAESTLGEGTTLHVTIPG